MVPGKAKDPDRLDLVAILMEGEDNAGDDCLEEEELYSKPESLESFCSFSLTSSL